MTTVLWEERGYFDVCKANIAQLDIHVKLQIHFKFYAQRVDAPRGVNDVDERQETLHVQRACRSVDVLR